LGCGLGVPFIAAEPRIRAAVLGLNGAETSAEAAAQITVPVEIPVFELDSALRFSPGTWADTPVVGDVLIGFRSRSARSGTQVGVADSGQVREIDDGEGR
jgi:hypothetical protein